MLIRGISFHTPIFRLNRICSSLKDDIKENIITKLSLDKGQGALIDTFDKLAEELVKRRFRAVTRFPAKRARV